MRRMQGYLPYCTAFFLPLGFFGGIGVGLGLLYALTSLRKALKLERTLFYFSLPLLFIGLISSGLPENRLQLLPLALGLGLSFSLGLQLIKHLLQSSDKTLMLASFLIGSMVLALSVMIDFFTLQNPLPSGLFLRPNLHNWTASILALAFPVSLHFCFLRNKNQRLLGLVGLVVVTAGMLFALSWVGVLGMLAGLLIFLSHKSKASLISIVLLIGLVFLVVSRFTLSSGLTIRGFGITNLTQRIFERFDIFLDGLSRGLLKPFLGWGTHNVGSAYINYPSASYRDHNFEHFHNAFVQFFFETGIFGLMLFLILLLAIWFSLNGKFSAMAKAAFVAFLVTQSFDYSLLQSSIVSSFLLVTLSAEETNPKLSKTQYSLLGFSLLGAGLFFGIYINSASPTLASSDSGVHLQSLVSPKQIKAGEPFTVMLGLETVSAPYTIQMEVCHNRCRFLPEISVLQAGNWWGEVGKLTLTQGRHTLNLYVSSKLEHKKTLANYSWRVNAY